MFMVNDHALCLCFDCTFNIPACCNRSYPKDSDKHMLAKQAGLTRSQVRNDRVLLKIIISLQVSSWIDYASHSRIFSNFP